MRKISLPKFLFFLLVPLFLTMFVFLNLFIFTSKASANDTLFEDNFEDGLGKWEAVRGSINDWSIQNGRAGAIVSPSFTIIEIVPKSEFWDDEWGNYAFEVDMFPKQGTDKNLSFRFQDLSRWYEIHHTFRHIVLPRIFPNQNERLARVYFPLQNNTNYHIKIVLKGDSIKVFIDDQLVIDVIDENTPLRTGKIGLKIGTGTVHPTEVWFDNVMVTSLEEEKEPLVLLPGLGGSWNFETIIKGGPSEQKDWYMTPFVKIYDGLIQSLQNAGYELNTNLFIFNYNWTKQVDLIADDLKNYIDNVVDPPEGTEIDLVGHSLGGMVARTYVQNDPNNSVSQLITVGSPHQGTAQVYYAWEGANLNKVLPGWQRIPAGILLWRRKSPFENLVPSLQSLCPVLKNLLPSSPYLKKEEIPVPIENIFEKNDWLISLNNTVPLQLLEILKSSLGNAVDTVKWIEVEDRNRLDEILERWVDGRPTGNEEFAPGDNRVITENAILPGLDPSHIEELNLNHGDLVQTKEGQRAILDFLGWSLPESEIIPAPEIVYEPSLVFQLASLATIRVTDPSGRSVGFEASEPLIPDVFFDSDEKLIFIPNPEDGNYQIEIFPEGEGGRYTLLIGQINEEQDVWTEYQGEVTPNNPGIYTLPFDSTLETTDTYLANLINSKLKNLLKEIRQQENNRRNKARLTAHVLKILGQTKPLSVLLNLEKNNLATKFVQRAIFNTSAAIDYAEEFNPDSLPPLREILDLLGQLYQLLES